MWLNFTEDWNEGKIGSWLKWKHNLNLFLYLFSQYQDIDKNNLEKIPGQLTSKFWKGAQIQWHPNSCMGAKTIYESDRQKISRIPSRTFEVKEWHFLSTTSNGYNTEMCSNYTKTIFCKSMNTQQFLVDQVHLSISLLYILYAYPLVSVVSYYKPSWPLNITRGSMKSVKMSTQQYF